MAKFDEVFNTDSLPERSPSDPLPAGSYPVEIVSAEIKETKSGTGKYISIEYAVTDEKNNGRRIFGNLNVRNANPKAEEIGRAQLGELMRAIGLTKLGDSDQLIGQRLTVKVNIKKDAEYGDRNEVKSWKPLGSKPPKAPKASGTKEKESGGSPPWAKKKEDE